MIVKEERGKMERLNGFEGERSPCVCGYHGRGSHICGLAYPYLMIRNLSDDQIRHCDKLVWYIYDILYLCYSRYFLNLQDSWSSLANFTHKLLEREKLHSSYNHIGYTYRIRVKAQLYSLFI